MKRTGLALAALLAAASSAPASADALNEGITAARCRELPTLEERGMCYVWEAQVLEAERRWDEQASLTEQVVQLLKDRIRLVQENTRLRRALEEACERDGTATERTRP